MEARCGCGDCGGEAGGDGGHCRVVVVVVALTPENGGRRGVVCV